MLARAAAAQRSVARHAGSARRARPLASSPSSGGPPPADHVDAQLSSVLAKVQAHLGDVDGARTPGPKFLLRFTCAHGACERAETARTSSKIISQKSYKEGIVLVRCNCDKLHLISDKLGWFGDNTDIEQILAAKGESVVRRMVDADTLDVS